MIIIATGMRTSRSIKSNGSQKHKIMNIEEGDSIFLAITASANMEVIIADTLNELVCWSTYNSKQQENSCVKSWLYGRIENDVKYYET